MKGDFSRWYFNEQDNFNGVLMQQGRVLLDSDWNQQSEIVQLNQALAARDAIGPFIAAAPVHESDGFKVVQANLSGGQVLVELLAGHIWADGLPLRLGEPISLPASWLPAPFNSFIPNDETLIQNRTAVVLEVWRDVVNAFQMPNRLIEPALGGPDTVEQVNLAWRLRLLTLGPDEHCPDILGRLQDGPLGNLEATLQPTVEVDPDCPQVQGGGYTGFEHKLYRIEIAEPGGGNRFKWSSQNGGLVGRAQWDNINNRYQITANLQPISLAGRDNFYLEFLRPADDGRYWEVAHGAHVTLDGANLNQTQLIFGAPPTASGDVFIRLWDGLEDIAAFPKQPNPNELEAGIRLAFDAPAANNFRPGDYWNLTLRAADIANSELLLPNQPAQGPDYHRVPLAELNWQGQSSLEWDPIGDEIHDCRHIFHPLADQPRRGCCIPVAPGEPLHQVIEDLVRAGGGCICLLPGDHVLQQPVLLDGAEGITITGLGSATRLYINPNIDQPAFTIADSRQISFKSLFVHVLNRRPFIHAQFLERFTLEDTLFYAPDLPGKHILFQLEQTNIDWRVVHNTFFAPVAFHGLGLIEAVIEDNTFIGVHAGIDFTSALRLRILRNSFLGYGRDQLANIEDAISALDDDLLAQRDLIFAIAADLDFLASSNFFPNAIYTCVNIHNLFESSLNDNAFSGRIGVATEINENCEISRNTFLTHLTGADFGVTDGLRLNDNRLGKPNSDRFADNELRVSTGFRFINDVSDTQISGNRIHAREAIVFESDRDGSKEIVRDVEVQVLYDNPNGAPELLKGIESHVQDRLASYFLTTTNFYMLGTVRHVRIEGNTIDADRSAINWSGTNNILDFRIVSNSITGCQETAIRIEPDTLMFFLASEVDTSVRIIEKNRFDIYGAAIRSNIGAVRIEKNDIRIRNLAPIRDGWSNFGLAAGKAIYRTGEVAEAINKDDASALYMAGPVAHHEVTRNQADINLDHYAELLENSVMGEYQPRSGIALADRAITLKTLADARAPGYLLPTLELAILRLNTHLEGYAVNLTGIQNRVIHNRIHTDSSDIENGVILHQHADEIRDNQIVANRIGLLINPKAANTERNIAISGNTIRVIGTTTLSGRRRTVYAFVLPTLNPGHISIIGNHFEGGLTIGADPFNAWNFFRPNRFVLTQEPVKYHAVKYDAPAYAMALNYKASPKRQPPTYEIDPYIAEYPIRVITFWNDDPHRNRPVVQFADNRVVRGWAAIAQTTAGVHWTQETLTERSGEAMLLQVTNNTFDYGLKIAGNHLTITGNHSQSSIQYRPGATASLAANHPDPISF